MNPVSHLSAPGRRWLLVALGAMGVIGLGLAAVSEDVFSRDGMAVRDPGNLHFFLSHRSPALIEAARLASNIGAVGVLAVAAVVVGLALWLRGERLAVAMAPLVSLCLAGGVAAMVKALVGRARPPIALRLVTETESSFPSGHATDSAALFLTVGLVVAAVVLRRPLARLLVVGLAGAAALAVGLSRLVLGVHWPTDVLAGWGLGALVALAVTSTVLALPVGIARPGPESTRLALWRWRMVSVLGRSRPLDAPEAPPRLNQWAGGEV
jgi:membrane-associated phospholipid phosphatase